MTDAPTRTPTEVIHTTSRTVSCDGGTALGHPRVFLRIADRDAECPYCSRLFVLDGNGADHGH